MITFSAGAINAKAQESTMRQYSQQLSINVLVIVRKLRTRKSTIRKFKSAKLTMQKIMSYYITHWFIPICLLLFMTGSNKM